MNCPWEKSFLKMLEKLQKSPQLTKYDLNRLGKAAVRVRRLEPRPGHRGGVCPCPLEEEGLACFFALPALRKLLTFLLLP